ncbi:MAG: class I SAM-dependent methyltransferase, partial [Pseudomonadales bacterium]|nr:class I SAM-dependent methyltransferase [Pseudomonadales bacterium]
RVVGSDLSTGAINRARMEADTRGLDIAFSVADMRDCGTHHEHGFDVVLSGDNSVPHLERPDDISRTLAGMRECLRPGGLAVIGIRDYKAEDERSVGQVFTYGTRNHGEDRYVVFQTRDWHGDAYDVGMYFVREETDSAPSHVISGRSRFYAITVDAMMALMQSAGFSDVRRIDNASHNVLVTGHRA